MLFDHVMSGNVLITSGQEVISLRDVIQDEQRRIKHGPPLTFRMIQVDANPHHQGRGAEALYVHVTTQPSKSSLAAQSEQTGF